MARTQSKSYPEIRENILKSAAKLFAVKGFSTATIEDLAHACNSSRGALYHYFDSKEEILGSIVAEHVSTMLDELQKVGEQRLEPREHLHAVARCIMEINASNNAEQIILLNDWNQIEASQQKDIAEAQRKIVSIVRNALTRLDDSRRLTPKLSSTYAMMLLGILNYTYTWYDPKGPVTPSEYAARAVDVFLDGFRSPPSQP